jgi:NADP-dependent aldehyde dehydrogenase
MAKLSGRSLIGFREGDGSGEPLYATDPMTGQPLQPGFTAATAAEVELAVCLASDAFATYSRVSGHDRVHSYAWLLRRLSPFRARW